MNDFTYSYPMKVYFGEDAAQKAITAELGKFGEKVMLAYGGGSIKKSGIYEEKIWKGALFGTAASFAVLNPAYTMTVPKM